jgi:uncharacterized protein (DUF2384 family)
MPWIIGNQQVETPANPGALSDVDQLLERIVAAFGVRPTSKLLGVDGSTVSNWRSNHRRMSSEMRGRVVDLHDVLNRALLVFPADIAVLWLFGSEPFLDGKRPIDVLTIRGAAPLIDALRNIEAGAYA